MSTTEDNQPSELVSNEPSIESEPVDGANNTIAREDSAGSSGHTEEPSSPSVNRVPSSELDPQGILSPETVSVKQRFLYARRMQQMREQERLNRVKQDPKQTIKSARASFYESAPLDLQSPASKAFGDKFASGVSTDSLWTETVQKMKQQQQERKNLMKSSTVAYSKQLQQNRVVTQRISQWEELFIQTETTAEELAQIWKIVKEYFHLFSTAGAANGGSGGMNGDHPSSDNLADLLNNSSLGEKSASATTAHTINDSAAAEVFRGKPGVIDDFTLGGTRVYSADTFGEKFVTFLTESFQELPAMTKYIGLVSGIFSEKSYKPPLRVITMALKGDSGAFYVAITIKPLAGHEDDGNLLGNRKIVVFKPNNAHSTSSNNLTADAAAEAEKAKSRSTDSADGNSKRNSNTFKGEKIFDITFSIVFTPSAEREEGNHDTIDVHDCNSLDAFNTLVRSTHQRKSMGGKNHTGDIPEEFRSAVSAHNSPYVEHDDDEEGEGEGHSNPPDDIVPVDLNAVQREEEDEDEEDGPEQQSEVIADGIATTSAALEDTVANESTNQDTTSRRLSNKNLRVPTGTLRGGKGVLSDAINFEESAVVSQFTIDEPLIDVITSSSQYLIVKTCDPQVKNILVTSSGRASNVGSQNVAENDQVFEWIRGVAASGWISKFPTSKSFGRYVRRFFILQDNTLTYYKYKPSQEEFFNPHEYKADIQLHKDNDEDVEELSSAFAVGGYYVGGKAMIISDDTVIEKTSSMMQPILKISTPSTNQVLALRVKRGGEKEQYWIQAIQKTIEIQKMKRTSVSPTIKTLWLHENPTYELRCMDVKTSQENHAHHLKAALYFCELPAYCKRVQHHPNALTSRYILDLETDHTSKEKLQLEIMKTNEKPFNDVDIQVIKLFGDVVVMGGNQGYLGIGTVGMTTDLTMGSTHQRVLYAVPCRADTHALQAAGISYKNSKKPEPTYVTGHSPESTIKCVAVCLSQHLIVASDDERTISLWKFEQESIPAAADSAAASAGPSTSMMLKSPQKKKAGFYYHIKPQLQTLFNLSRLDDANDGGFYVGETIVSMTFLSPHDTSHLIVSTTKRLLLLEIGMHYQFMEERGKEGSPDVFQVLGWSELDRVPTAQQFGLFSLAMFDASSASATGASSAAHAGNSRVVGGSKVNISASMIGKHAKENTSAASMLFGNASSAAPARRFLYWKALKNENDSTWTVTKVELSEEKIQEAIHSIQPLK